MESEEALPIGALGIEFRQHRSFPYQCPFFGELHAYFGGNLVTEEWAEIVALYLVAETTRARHLWCSAMCPESQH